MLFKQLLKVLVKELIPIQGLLLIIKLINLILIKIKLIKIHYNLQQAKISILYCYLVVTGIVFDIVI